MLAAALLALAPGVRGGEAAMTDEAKREQARWRELLGTPEHYAFEPKVELLRRYDAFPDLDIELYRQNNGPGTSQRVLLVLPKRRAGRVPAVAVPFYFPEAMLGFDPDTRETFPRYEGIDFMAQLARRGYASASAESYHLTYAPSDLGRTDFSRWRVMGERLNADHPEWTGIGKLTADTRLVIDLLAADDRIDAARIGIFGHSLGGKMAFYAGMLDDRVRVVGASDFGIRWEQTNWHDIWYWGAKLEDLKARGIDHTGLLRAGGGKPFFLIAGQFDDAASQAFIRNSGVYAAKPEYLGFFHHATGHRPTPGSLAAAYDFFDRFLKP